MKVKVYHQQHQRKTQHKHWLSSGEPCREVIGRLEWLHMGHTDKKIMKI